ncbi:ATP-binding protein [Infirmifilum sp. NZ]|uniref:ATP-binding protein n=1 Tax=Infirmifilum sp. NZ TaxID=2926850 RepID=UPI0027A242D3|nr:ATP-binding protein [Infirmifilum sp. NZ]UNQ73569.1 ATP-binding protein [Infirmifilum sp. NZ]
MIQLFVDREEELRFLEEKYTSPGAQLLVIYGRRRIGKTELLLRSVKGRKHVYYLAERTSIPANIAKLARRMAEYLGRESFARISFADFEELFADFLEWKPRDERVVVIIDEFPYLVELDPGVLSLFQRVWDEYLSRRSDVVLVLCGSSVGMMETEVLSYRSPLYGRRTGQWKVQELGVRHILSFAPGFSPEEAVKVYGAVGGVPAYLKVLDPSVGFMENLERLFFRRGAVLYEEAENLLRQELREPRSYKLILQALAEGRRRVTEISSATGLDKTAVSKYLDTLELLDVVGYETPVLAAPKTRKRLYFIKDNYFNFWFRYVQPNRDLIESDRVEEVLEIVSRDYDNYMGPVFERVARKFIYKASPAFPVAKAGRHWFTTPQGKVVEIDILAHDSAKERFLACEVKWSKLGAKDLRRLAWELEEKVRLLNLNAEVQKCIIARELSKSEAPEGVLVFNLDDIIGSV